MFSPYVVKDWNSKYESGNALVVLLVRKPI